MNAKLAKSIIDKAFLAVFGQPNPYDLATFQQKFAFDVFLPQSVQDYITGQETWTDATRGEKFITEATSDQINKERGWMRPKEELKNLDQILKIWQEINSTNTERGSDNANILESDTIYRSENIYRCTNCNDAKNLVFCDSCGRSKYLVACSRSFNDNFCIRTDDSANCSNCFEIMYSGKIANSLFIQDCFDLYECLFCAHIVHQKFCIANMQFEEAEYFAIKAQVIEWILS